MLHYRSLTRSQIRQPAPACHKAPRSLTSWRSAWAGAGAPSPAGLPHPPARPSTCHPGAPCIATTQRAVVRARNSSLVPQAGADCAECQPAIAMPAATLTGPCNPLPPLPSPSHGDLVHVAFAEETRQQALPASPRALGGRPQRPSHPNFRARLRVARCHPRASLEGHGGGPSGVHPRVAVSRVVPPGGVDGARMGRLRVHGEHCGGANTSAASCTSVSPLSPKPSRSSRSSRHAVAHCPSPPLRNSETFSDDCSLRARLFGVAAGEGAAAAYEVEGGAVGACRKGPEVASGSGTCYDVTPQPLTSAVLVALMQGIGAEIVRPGIELRARGHVGTWGMRGGTNTSAAGEHYQTFAHRGPASPLGLARHSPTPGGAWRCLPAPRTAPRSCTAAEIGHPCK